MPTLKTLAVIWSVAIGVALAPGELRGQGLSDASASDLTVAFPSLGERPTPNADGPLFFVLAPSLTVFQSADSTRPYVELSLHDPVRVLEDSGAWVRVKTMDGASGFAWRSELSNIWIRVKKAKKTVYVYEGENLALVIPADLAYNFFSDKKRQGSARRPDHWRTPEGKYFVVSKNADSQFHKAFVLNYPNLEDAERGLREGLITVSEFQQIARAAERHQPSPMGTALGGLIEIHGGGTGARTNWTKGCIAISNEIIDRLWTIVDIGTPVLIEP